MNDQRTAVLEDDHVAAVATEEQRRPIALAILLIIGGALGLLASFELTLDKFFALEHPGAKTNCFYSLVVQCDKNLASWQGSLFGFPNPVVGLVCFTAPIFVGVFVLAGVRFPRWIWALFNVGMFGGILFVMWLITESIFFLGTLCPWCMLVWSVVIPMSIATTLYNLAQGNLLPGPGARRFGSALYGWTPLITLLVYVTVAVMSQVRLNVLAYL